MSGASATFVDAPKGETHPRLVIFASSLGTVFEWYDFYLYGTLAAFFGAKFFPSGNETAVLLANLAVFGAGFGVRPLGAIVFGHLGDLWGAQAHLPSDHRHHGRLDLLCRPRPHL